MVGVIVCRRVGVGVGVGVGALVMYGDLLEKL